MIAVALHHPFSTIVHSGLEACVAGHLILEVTLHVGLVHDVKPIGIEHGIHLRLTRIVACAHRIDIVCIASESSRNIVSTSMPVHIRDVSSRIDTLEDPLIVDVDKPPV